MRLTSMRSSQSWSALPAYTLGAAVCTLSPGTVAPRTRRDVVGAATAIAESEIGEYVASLGMRPVSMDDSWLRVMRAAALRVGFHDVTLRVSSASRPEAACRLGNLTR